MANKHAGNFDFDLDLDLRSASDKDSSASSEPPPSSEPPKRRPRRPVTEETALLPELLPELLQADAPSSPPPYPLYPDSASDDPEPSGPRDEGEGEGEDDRVRLSPAPPVAPVTPAPAPVGKRERMPSPYDDEAGDGPPLAAEGEQDDHPEPEEPLLPPEDPEARKRRRRKRILIAVPIVLVSLAAIGLALFTFAGDAVFRAAWPTIDKKLSAQGIYLEFEDIDQVRTRGFAMKNVILFRDEERTDQLMTLSDVAARITVGNDNTGGGLGVSITFEDAGLLINTGKNQPMIEGIGGAVSLGGGGLDVDTFAARFQGLALSIHGQTTWETLEAALPPGDASPESDDAGQDPPEADQASEPVDLTKLDLTPLDQFTQWARFTGPGAPLLLDLTFAGEEEQPLTADISLSGQRVHWNDVPLEAINVQIHADLGAGGRKVTIGPAELVYEDDIFSAQAVADLDLEVLIIEDLHSALDFPGLISRVHPPSRTRFEMVSWPVAPDIRLKGMVPFANIEGIDVDGSLSLPEGMVLHLEGEPLTLSKLTAEFAFREETFSTKNFTVETLGGLIVVEGSARPLATPIAFSTKIAANTLSLGAIASFLGSPTESSDTMSLTCTAEGDLNLIDIPQLQINHLDKSLNAEASLDLEKETLDIRSLKSNLHVIELARRLHGKTAEQLAMVSSASGPEINLSGQLPLKEPQGANLDVSLKSGEGFVLALSGAPLTLTNLATQLKLADGTLSTESFQVEALGGTVSANLIAQPFEEQFPFATGLLVNQVELQQFADFMGTDKTVPGQGSINFQGNGVASLAGITGNGQISVEGMEIYTIPILGKLLEPINKAGMLLKPKDSGFLRGSYAIDKGIVSSDELHFRASGFEIFAPGKVDLINESVDLLVQVRQTGLMGAASKVTGKSLEVTVTGPFDNLDTDFGGGVVGSTIGAADKLTEAVTGGGNAPAPEPVVAAPPPQAAPPQPAPAPPPPPPKKKGFFESLNPFD